MLGRQRKIVALIGQPRQFLVAAEIVRRLRERLLPAGDSFGQRTVNTLKRLLRGGVSEPPETVKNASGCRLLPGFKA